VVSLDQTSRRAMPAGLAILECPTLARSVGLVNFIRRAENQERMAVEVNEGVGFELLLCANDCCLPAAIIGGMVECLLDYLLHSVLI
jgi:hypothetical protein